LHMPGKGISCRHSFILTRSASIRNFQPYSALQADGGKTG